MNIEQQLIERINNYEPSEATITDGCVTYRSTTRTHRSYAAQLNSAPERSSIRRTYLQRCYDWLVLLKKNNIELYHIIKS